MQTDMVKVTNQPQNSMGFQCVSLDSRWVKCKAIKFFLSLPMPIANNVGSVI